MSQHRPPASLLPPAFRVAAMLAVVGAASSAFAQWTTVSLHPAGALNSEAQAITATRQVGFSDNRQTALVWSGSSSSAVTLNPVIDGGASADAAAGSQQGGSVSLRVPAQGVGFFSHAALWSGTRGSWIDLHPSDPAVKHTNIAAMEGTTQVGSYGVAGGGTFSGGKACMWSGTAASFVNLNPAGVGSSEARGVFGPVQVGGVFDSGLGTACMWTGSAESFIDLNPPEAIASVAVCADATHQYGVIGILDPVPGLFPARWSGTAESWVNLGVPDPETHWGEIHAAAAGVQVGYITDNDGISNERAALWSTEPGTYVDLHQFVPAMYTGSNALGVYKDSVSGSIYVVGYVVNAATQREAIMWVKSTGVNLLTSPSAPVDCAVNAGQPITYTVRVANVGNTGSGAVTLTVDLPPASVATFAGASPTPTSVTGTQAIFTLAPIAAGGAFTDVTLTLTAVGAGATSTITATASTAGEVDAANNTAAASTRIQPAVPATAAAKGILSTNSALANSLTPTGARYTGLNKAFSSPNGAWWTLAVTTNQPTAQNSVLVRSATGGTPTIVAQTGVTAFPHGTLQNLLTGAEVNNFGLVAFGGDDTGATASDSFVATTDGTTVTETAREGAVIPGMPGITYGSGLGGSINIFTNGQTAFSTSSTPAGSNAYLSNNGGLVLARVAVTTPTGASFPVKNILNNTTGVWGLAMDATGTHSIYQADINNGGTSTDQVVVADGTVIMQEGVTVLGAFTSAVDGGNKYISMGPGGTWMVRGSNSIAQEDWVVRGSGASIQQVYMVGDPVVAGATEHWAEDGVVTGTFVAHAADAAGNFVIAGYTDNADAFTNSVIAYNNTTVLARENDPVDLDGNGIFDDGMYIRTINADSVAFVQGALLVTVNLRDEDAALCHTNDTDRGQALIRVPLPSACAADFNNSGALTVQDIFDFLGAWFAGDARADFNHANGLSVQDIFDFLAAWFAGC